MDGIKNKIDVDALRSRTIDRPYPNFHISKLNNTVPIVISSLEEGDVPLLGTLNGTTKILKRISNSAININRLLRVTEVEYHKDANNFRNMKSIEDYMEVALEWICCCQ